VRIPTCVCAATTELSGIRAILSKGHEAYQSARLYFCWSLPRTKT